MLRTIVANITVIKWQISLEHAKPCLNSKIFLDKEDSKMPVLKSENGGLISDDHEKAKNAA